MQQARSVLRWVRYGILRLMNHSFRRAASFCFVILFLILSSCSRDPNVRKQKFVAQGDAYFNAGKYPEAQISYSRALQIDPRYVVALYKSAQCSERVGNWNAAFNELLRTVDLDPQNWPAQLDLGKIFLGAGKPQEAKDRALLILHSNPKDVDAQILLSGSRPRRRLSEPRAAAAKVGSFQRSGKQFAESFILRLQIGHSQNGSGRSL